MIYVVIGERCRHAEGTRRTFFHQEAVRRVSVRAVLWLQSTYLGLDGDYERSQRYDDDDSREHGYRIRGRCLRQVMRDL